MPDYDKIILASFKIAFLLQFGFSFMKLANLY